LLCLEANSSFLWDTELRPGNAGVWEGSPDLLETSCRADGVAHGRRRAGEGSRPSVTSRSRNRTQARFESSPYSVADYNAIGEEYGSAADLRELVATAHKLGLKVMLDIVYYHAAPDNVLMNRPELFVRNAEGKVVRGFWPQPLPDFKNPEMRKYLIDSLVYWVREFDVDGYRCDVAAGVPIDFWEEARKELDRVKPDVVLLSEADRPEDQLAAFDINYNFHHHLTLRSVLRDGESAIRVREHWERTNRTMPRGARVLHYSDNHDWRRAVVEFGERGAMAATVLNFTLDGIPFVWAGQEIADRRRTRFRDRAPIRWENLTGSSADSKEQQATLEKYKKLFRIRKEQAALHSGELIWINNTAPDSVLSFLRKRGAEEILVIINLSNRKTFVTVDLPVMEYYSVENLLKEGKTWFQLYTGRVSATLGAFEEIVGKKIPLEPLKDPGREQERKATPQARP